MTANDLSEIELEVGFLLPAKYREVAVKQPFRPSQGDSVYWFFGRPQDVIGETLSPLSDGDYDLAGWQSGYLAIGYSYAGDVYILDTTSNSLSVHQLSHETHQIEKAVWPTFDDFVEEWLRIPDEVEKAIAENNRKAQAEQSARMRRGFLVVAAILVACLMAPLVMSLFIKR